MKVGIITYDLSSRRGGTKLTISLGKELQNAGYAVCYCAVFADTKKLSEWFGEEYNFKVYSPKKTFLGRKITNVSARWNLSSSVKKMIDEFQPDVVIEMGGVITTLEIPIKKKIPTIHYAIFPASLYSEINLYKVSLAQKVYSKILRNIEKKFAKKIDKIIAMDKFIQGLVKEHWRVESDIIFPPTNTDIFKPGKKKDQIFSVSVFNKLHRLDEFIFGFKKLQSNYTLVLCGQKGDDEYFHHLEELAAKENNVKILPADLTFEELLQAYKESKIFWYPAWTHFGLTIAEAQCCGIPVISLGKGMGPGEIVIDKKTGFIVEKFEDIFEKTKILLKNQKLFEEMSRAARQNGLERLSHHVFRQKFVEQIERLRKEKKEI